MTTQLQFVRAPHPTRHGENPGTAPASHVAVTPNGLYIIHEETYHWGRGYVAWRRCPLEPSELIGDRFTRLSDAQDACQEHWDELCL